MKALRNGLNVAGFNNITKGVIQHARSLVQNKHFYEVSNSFQLIEPFLEMFKRLNAGFEYEITCWPLGELEDISVLMPYCNHGIQNSYELLGIDGGHQKEVIAEFTSQGNKKDLHHLKLYN